MSDEKTYVTLKWGTLKSWNFTTEAGQALLKRFYEIGMSASAMLQHHTPEQVEIICQMIDLCDGETIYLDWDGKDVSKEEAKQYVREYGAKKAAA